MYFDPGETGGALIQRFGGNHDAGRDHTAEVLAFERNGIECRGRAEINDDGGRAVLVNYSNGVHNAVGSDLARIVVQNRNSGILVRHKYGLHGKVHGHHLVQHRVQRRHNGSNDDPLNLLRVDLLQREEIPEQNSVLIHGSVFLRGQPPVHHKTVAVIDTEHGIGVAEIDG